MCSTEEECAGAGEEDDISLCEADAGVVGSGPVCISVSVGEDGRAVAAAAAPLVVGVTNATTSFISA